MTSYPSAVPGDHLGLPFPTTIEPLLEQGAAFLTRAFQASGALSADNRVTAITASKEFFGGGMGRKLLLSVTYEKAAAGVHEDLFVKFPRDFGDPLRDLFGPLMEPEVRFALLSQRPDFPIAVPQCYFADYNAATVSGILITERIAYGQGRIEPCHDKCLDYESPICCAITKPWRGPWRSWRRITRPGPSNVRVQGLRNRPEPVFRPVRVVRLSRALPARIRVCRP